MPKKILIVDDQAAILDVVSEALIEFGYQTSTLANAEKIFDRIDEFEPDLILLDIMLGAVDGKIVCPAIKEKYHVPIIAISGNANNGATLFQHGAPDDFVLKPFDLTHLIKKVEAQLLAYA